MGRSETLTTPLAFRLMQIARLLWGIGLWRGHLWDTRRALRQTFSPVSRFYEPPMPPGVLSADSTGISRGPLHRFAFVGRNTKLQACGCTRDWDLKGCKRGRFLVKEMARRGKVEPNRRVLSAGCGTVLVVMDDSVQEEKHILLYSLILFCRRINKHTTS
ncbi:hypothetical protein AAFF_G00132790 [Aldrovandia affinis]|uniref:Uncharacterized protein n=1 Tax=Aldrovandia affinis TaxID=143900 RepID=A0AAD7RQZ8_9TELE|nr:hypothetical protein AAFF_G00132790 [Aldrovandia affinis]